MKNVLARVPLGLTFVLSTALSLTVKASTVPQVREVQTYILACEGKMETKLDVRIAACTKVLASGVLDQKNFAAVLTDRASAYDAMQKSDLAVQDATQALQFQPDSAAALDVRCRARAEIGEQFDAALADCNRSLEIRPNNLATLESRGFLKLRMKNYPGAINDLSLVISPLQDDRKSKLRMMSLTWRAEAYSHLDNYDKALQDYDAALEMFPRNPVALNGRCWLRVRQGKDLDKALTDCDGAVRLDPEDGAVLDSRCLVRFRMDDYDRAISDCSAAIDLDNQLAGSHFIRGLAKLRKGDAAGGNTDINAAKAIKPDVAEIYSGYGVKP